METFDEHQLDSPEHHTPAIWDQRTSQFVRRALPATLLAGILEIGTLLSLPEPEIAIAAMDILLFVYLSWIWEVRAWGSRSAGVTHGVGIGVTLGFIIGLTKFLLWKKFYSLFYLITDPIFKALIASVVVGATITLLRSAKFRLFFQRFKHKP